MAKKVIQTTAQLMARVREKCEREGGIKPLADWMNMPAWRIKEWVIEEKYKPNGEIALSLIAWIEGEGKGHAHMMHGLRCQALRILLEEVLPKNEKGQVLTGEISDIYPPRMYRYWRDGGIPGSEPILALRNFVKSKTKNK